MKKTMFSLVQPAIVVALIIFWMSAPEAWVKSPWTIVIVGALITALIQGLELVVERYASWRINKREFATDLFYVIFNTTVIGWVTTHLAEDPLLAVKQSLGITTQWAMHMPFLAQVALVIFLIEFGQYWMHRLMHNNSFFWSTHAPHHHVTQLNAMKGAIGNPLELFLISLSVVALFDLQDAAIFCGANILHVISSFAHANTRLDPPRWYAFFFTTIRHHSLHHSVDYDSTRCNYANSFILLDRIFGTYREGESEIVGQDERRRLSIKEQFLFPFLPLIERFNAKRAESTSTAG